MVMMIPKNRQISGIIISFILAWTDEVLKIELISIRLCC